MDRKAKRFRQTRRTFRDLLVKFSRATNMLEDSAGVCTRPIKCKHTDRHCCFIDIDFEPQRA